MRLILEVHQSIAAVLVFSIWAMSQGAVLKLHHPSFLRCNIDRCLKHNLIDDGSFNSIINIQAGEYVMKQNGLHKECSDCDGIDVGSTEGIYGAKGQTGKGVNTSES